MIVFSNTTPFIALSSIDRLELLPRLFEKVHVAQSVIDECAEGGPIPVPPLLSLEWVIPVPDEARSSRPVLLELDRGERQTILLANKFSQSTVIIERLARRIAEFMGMTVTGTLGVLAKAKTVGAIPSFHEAAQAMREQGLRYNEGLIARIAQHLGELDL